MAPSTVSRSRSRRYFWPSFGVVLAIVIAASLHGQERPDFSADRFKAHVAFLADDLLEGREAGTRGHEIAARYVASEFTQLGVKPAAPDGTYYEPVQLLEWSVTSPAPTLTITTPRGAQALRHRVDAFITGSPSGGATQVKGPLVFAGYGVVDRAIGRDDYKDLDVRGKIAVVFGAPIAGIDSEIAAHAFTMQREVAAERGAIGILGIQTRQSAATFPFEVMIQLKNMPETTWVRDDGTPFDSGYGMKASAFVAPKAAAMLFDGASKTLEQVLDEAEKPGGTIAGFPLKATAELKAATKVRRYASPDVVGLIRGSDPVLQNEFVMLMAHVDHIGLSPGNSGDRINNGALDNAAGTATLLEVARAFTTGQPPKRSVLVVANTAEEKGLLGAEYLAHNPPVPIDRIVAAVDLDMPLLLYDFTDVVAYGGSHSTIEKAIKAAGAEMGVSLSPDPMPEQSIFVRSDHYAMAKMGVPAIMLATGMANGGQAAWSSFLRTQYHHPGDDLSQSIHWQAGARFAELNYRTVRILADSGEPARWYEGDYFGNLFARNAKKAPRN